MTEMPTWQHFLEERLGTCVESWAEQKLNPTFNTSLTIFFAKKIIEIQL
jgi:hypothetical protein